MKQQKTLHPLEQLDGCMNTYTGLKFNILDPHPDQINIQDIAKGLANTCHFGGQVKSFFSVAQHSMMVMELAPDDLIKEALLHDAAEAYVGDCIKPLKVLLPEYQAIEKRILEVIFERFGLDITRLPEIKPMDKKIQQKEYAAFYKEEGEIYCWSPATAYVTFVQECRRLQIK